MIAFAGLCAAIGCAAESVADKPTATPAAVSAESVATGKATYATLCAPCHGEGGKGDGPASKVFKPSPRDHTDPAYMSTISDEDLGRVITMGGLVKGKPNMPSNPQLKGDELASVIAYVRSLARPH